tara:strand:+ start:5127 stop:5405 length:279 start_codon:yes stop_codon:yes gene_type:complete
MNKSTKATDNWFRSLKEDTLDEREIGEDREGAMAKRQLYNVIEQAQEVHDMLGEEDELEAWVQSKLTKIASMMSVVQHYLNYEYKEESEELE